MLGGDCAGGKGVCGKLMSPAQETQSMREIRLLRGRLPCKGGGLTGMEGGTYKKITGMQDSNSQDRQKYIFDIE